MDFLLVNWALVVGDFRREYHMTPDELAGMSAATFHLYLKSLSPRARFVTAWEQQPKHVYDPDEIAAIKAAARR